MIGLLLATMGAEADNWPDGSRMDDWFLQSGKVDVAQLGRQYVITDYGVATDSTLVQTTLIQHVISSVRQARSKKFSASTPHNKTSAEKPAQRSSIFIPVYLWAFMSLCLRVGFECVFSARSAG
jgi:hypothetical protein